MVSNSLMDWTVPSPQGSVILIRAMPIICPSCATSYELRPNALPPHGQVRCLRCQTVWSPQLYQADKLLTAAAAIAADFGFQHEVNPSEAPLPQAESSADIVASDFLPELSTAEMGPAKAPADCSVAAESAAAEPEPNQPLVVASALAADLEFGHLLDVVEGAAVNPGSGSRSVAEIVIINPDADRVVTASASANLLPAPSIFAEVATPDSRLDHAFARENHAGLDVDVTPVPLVPPNEQLQSSVSETLAAEHAVGMLSDGERLRVNLFAEADESSAGQAINALEEGPSPNRGYLAVMSEEARNAAVQGVEKCSVDMICLKLEAALSEHVEPGACERPMDLRADYYNRFSERAENIERRTRSRARRKAEVEQRSLNIRKRRFIPRWPLSNLHSGIVALALLDIFLVGGRTDIVRKLPQTASFYALAGLPVNLRGLAFENVTTSTVRDDGTPVLVVEGNVTNDTRKNVRVPQIRFVVRDAAAQEIYSWTASAARTSLPPGQAATFRARLASPPPGAHDLVLRFVSRRDAIAIIR
jgi:predicted Zn finger-like uncharacterized protein